MASDTQLAPEPVTTIDMELPHQSFSSDRNVVIAAFIDLASGMKSVGLWLGLAWEEFVQRYRRSYIGIAWAVLSFMVFTLAILFFVAAIRDGILGEMTVFILFGFLFFQLCSSLVTDGTYVFITSQQWIKSVRLPFTVFVMRGMARSLMVFAFNCIGAGLILAFYGYRPTSAGLWAIPGLLAVIFNALWIYLLLGTVVARFRDLGHAIEAVMRMAFFITPIMWLPPEGGMRRVIAEVNPFTHFIALMRDPLLYGTVPVFNWMVVGCISVVGTLIGFAVFARYRGKIVLWV
ncbi:MAG: ABC transporter permease [Pseudomonadota bacterium]